MAAVDDTESARDGLAVLVARANGGDRESLTELHACLAGGSDLWPVLAALHERARAAWVELVSGGDAARRETIEAELARGAADLAGPAAGPLVRVLGDRTALAGLRLRHLECAVGAAVGVEPRPGGQGRLNRRLDRARREYESALRQLRAARRLLGG